jgi:rhodanese-related sulfurtransferase
MIETLKKILGIGPSADYAQLVKDGAIILDVRTKGEYAGGHIKGSLNISVDQLSANLHRLPNKRVPIITCCASGMRSASAKALLQTKGYHAYNGGGWASLRTKL